MRCWDILAAVRVAVVGHVEWVEFALVESVPAPGEIAHARETWAEAAGGGAVAAVQLRKLAGACALFTVFGNDELGRRARRELEGRGVTVHAVTAREPQRRAFTFVDSAGERTITVLGEKLRPSGDDRRLPWHELGDADAVFFVSGDVAAAAAARRARLLVATAGHLGGWTRPGGPFRAAPVPGRVADAYGCGDSFAAGLTYALAAGRSRDDALDLAARCGAAVLTGRGAYEGQLTLADAAPPVADPPRLRPA